jgi:hypothetical protein
MPPVATNLFVASAVFRKPFGQVTRAVLPTLGLTCVALLILMYVPTLSKAVINVKRGQPMVEHFPFGRAPHFEDAEPTETADGTPDEAPPTTPSAATNMADLTAKSMGAWDDEADAGPKPDAAPATNMKDLTRKAMGAWDDEEPASVAPPATTP